MNPAYSAQRTQPTAPDTIEGVTLSREELFVMLRLIKAPAMPGFDTAWARVDAAGEPVGEALEAVRVGTDALIARGYLTILPPTTAGARPHLEAPAPVVALVGVCARSPFVVRVAGFAGGVYQEFFIGQLGPLGALHSTPLPNVHLFMPFKGRAGVLKAVVTLLGVDGAQASGGQLGVASFDGIQRAFQAEQARNAEGMRLAVRQALGSQDGREGIAHGIEESLAHDPIWTQLTVGTHNASGATIERNLFTLAGAGSAWLFSPLPEDPSLLGVYTASVDRVGDWVNAQLPVM